MNEKQKKKPEISEEKKKRPKKSDMCRRPRDTPSKAVKNYAGAVFWIMLAIVLTVFFLITIPTLIQSAIPDYPDFNITIPDILP